MSTAQPAAGRLPFNLDNLDDARKGLARKLRVAIVETQNLVRLSEEGESIIEPRGFRKLERALRDAYGDLDMLKNYTQELREEREQATAPQPEAVQ